MKRKKLYLWCIGWAVTAAFMAPLSVAAAESCMDCHGDVDAVGAELAIDPLRFDHTAHADLGCSGCHAVGQDHPDDGLSPSRAACGDCHQDISDEYALSEHAAGATCGDCHNPHAAHNTGAVSGMDMNRQCAACHASDEMATAHGVWLPQAELHLEMLPCVSCHTGSENYVINLFITKRPADPASGVPARGEPFNLVTHEELREITGDKDIAALIDANGTGTISISELRRFNGSSEYPGLRLKGMLTPESVTHNVQILDNRWDCTFCHASGGETMQTSYLSLPQPDGSYRRMSVEKGAILDVLNGTPDFYMMGATRNASMNLLGLVIIAGGLVMPVGHGFLRFLTRKNRR
ncbi:MAG: cytochrome c3 family protein [Desulfuromonadales bacterium]